MDIEGLRDTEQTMGREAWAKRMFSRNLFAQLLPFPNAVNPNNIMRNQLDQDEFSRALSAYNYAKQRNPQSPITFEELMKKSWGGDQPQRPFGSQM